MMEHSAIEAIARELSDLRGSGLERLRLTESYPGLDLPTAYRISEAIRLRRQSQGDRCVGRKIGFTNRHMWQAYDVKAPIWGPMYESTVRNLPMTGANLVLGNFPNPKIEPEIVFRLCAPPRFGMTERDLLGCVEWVALGFELVSSIFAEWKFEAADAVAGFGVHAGLITCGRVPISAADDWVDRLAHFEVELCCDGELVAKGKGADVLGSPLSALRHLNELLFDPAYGPPLSAGEVVTTGTLTLAMPVRAGQIWTATPTGIQLPSITVLTKSKEV
jgi:2-oxo-3-hexenedioate decarboxylase